MAARKGTRCGVVGLVGALLLTISGGVEAQRGPGIDGPLPPPAIGARVGRDWDEDYWTVGGQVRFMLPFLPGPEFAPSGDVFLRDGPNEWQINLDVALRFSPFIYGGAGFAIARDSLPTSAGPSTETGYNLFLGLDVPWLRFPIKPFAEARRTEINRRVKPFRVVVGVNVPLGRQRFGRR
jgi:hypothetical protein